MYWIREAFGRLLKPLEGFSTLANHTEMIEKLRKFSFVSLFVFTNDDDVGQIIGR